VVRSGGSLVGLVVDQFHEGMDIILKPFSGILANIHGYSDWALLGDGRVLLVLNLKEHL
jgi:two-component system chemotaxis sensor kinase CheA